MLKKPYHCINSSVIDDTPVINISGNLSEISESDLQRDLLLVISGFKERKVLIIDIRNMKGRPGIGSTYYRVRNTPYYNLFKKVAFIDLIENKDYYSFHETTALNAGHNIRYFNDRDEAREWLKDGSPCQLSSPTVEDPSFSCDN